MIPKYTVEYTLPLRKHAPKNHFSTDDPVACEEFVEELLERGFGLIAIKHEGVDLPKSEHDRIVKTAAAMVASKMIRQSLGIDDADEVKYRFGFAG